MKKLDIFKTIQLVVDIILTAICIYTIIFNPEIYHAVAADPAMRLICGLLWVVLGLSFLFLFLDFNFFSSFKQDYRDLNFAVHSDPLSGIANRFSCDAVIEKYLDQPLPHELGCIMFDLTNIVETNRLYGHAQGNVLIKDFSKILKLASVDLCFVGRNGGNKFMALFESGTDDKIQVFLKRIHVKIAAYNVDPNTHPIEYRYGVAFHEGDTVKTITDLIALANKRIPQT